ncbi:MAG TPA: CHASE3 domain-containing protein [Terriglobales bacterium]|nr:CHASE3 domain-containing protein [Terriglobales bacterium]
MANPAGVRDSLLRRSLIWSLVGIVTIVLIAISGFSTLQQVDRFDFWLDHSRVVIGNIKNLQTDLTKAESAERGYLLTGLDRYLDPFHVAESEMFASFAKLKGLTADNPGQQERLDRLEPLMRARMSVMNDIIKLRATSGLRPALDLILPGRGDEMTRQVRELAQEVEDEEYRLLGERSRNRQKWLRLGFIGTLLAATLAMVAMITAPFDVRRAILQRELAAEKLRAAESRAHALFESAAQGIFVADREGRIVMANPAMTTIFGYSPEELQTMKVEQLVPESLRRRHVGLRDQYFHNPQSRPMGLGMDLQACRKDGSNFYAEISLSHIETATGTMAVVFVTDISKRRADEQAILQQRADLRGLAGKLMTAQDDERRRIARNLHDDLSQKLAYLSIDLGKLAMRPLEREVVDHVRGLQHRAAEAGETVRAISHELHPSVLDDIGLEAALEQYCEEFQGRTGIETTFHVGNLPPHIPRQVANSLYHIGQECLRNVAKHSRAEKASVTLSVSGNIMRLEVDDRGIGMKSEPRAGSSLGLVAMKERAHLVNGSVAVASREGEGTKVIVEIPLEENGQG